MKKVGNILLDILIVVIVVLALGMSMMVISSKATGVPNVMGYSPFTVQTDSMSGTFEVGDLLIIKQCNAENLKVGDVVTYKVTINNKQILNTHRIVKVYVENGIKNYITKGDHEGKRDLAPMYPTDVIGKWTGQKVSALGKIIDFIKTQTGIMICFVIPLALLFIWQLYKFISILGENKKEKAIEEVTANIEEEKQKAIEEYIAAQKAQQEAQAATAEPAPAPVKEEPAKVEETPAKPDKAEPAQTKPAEEEATLEGTPSSDEASAEKETPTEDVSAEEKVAAEKAPTDDEVVSEEAPAKEDIPAEATPVEADPKEVGPELVPADDDKMAVEQKLVPTEKSADETPAE